MAVASHSPDYAFDGIGNRLPTALGGDNAGQSLRQREGRRCPQFLMTALWQRSAKICHNCDARGRFPMSIRSKDGTFYDGTAAINMSVLPGISAHLPF